jgi:RDD family protein
LLLLVLFPVGQLLRFAIGWQLFTPPTGLGVWLASALNFSVPTWMYFVLSDSSARGATVGKSLLGLRVTRVNDGSVGMARALGRTAIKLMPWETTHLSAFAFSADDRGRSKPATEGRYYTSHL